jgi:hypothetical protein
MEFCVWAKELTKRKTKRTVNSGFILKVVDMIAGKAIIYVLVRYSSKKIYLIDFILALSNFHVISTIRIPLCYHKPLLPVDQK